MDYKSMMTNLAKTQGRESLYPYTIGVIGSILGDLSTTAESAESKVIEIVLTLRSMDAVLADESLPWGLLDTKIASAPTEARKKISQPQCTIDVSKVEPFLDRKMAEDVLKQEGQ